MQTKGFVVSDKGIHAALKRNKDVDPACAGCSTHPENNTLPLTSGCEESEGNGLNRESEGVHKNTSLNT
jgi:hypothetical protein